MNAIEKARAQLDGLAVSDTGRIHYAETKYGFEFGAVGVERVASDGKRGWVVLQLSTPRAEMQVYVTRTGLIRINGLKNVTMSSPPDNGGAR